MSNKYIKDFPGVRIKLRNVTIPLKMVPSDRWICLGKISAKKMICHGPNSTVNEQKLNQQFIHVLNQIIFVQLTYL